MNKSTKPFSQILTTIHSCPNISHLCHDCSKSVEPIDSGTEPDSCDLQMADNESICFTTSKSSIPRERREMVRPMSRKDIFYSGSVMNLPEFKSQKSLASYRQSVISLPKYAQDRCDGGDIEKGSKLHSLLLCLP
jgi:hypothetical protein